MYIVTRENLTFHLLLIERQDYFTIKQTDKTESISLHLILFLIYEAIFLTEEVEELRLLSTLAARSVCFFIFFPLEPEPEFEHLLLLQQGQLSNMYPAKPKMMMPTAMRRLRLFKRLEKSNLVIEDMLQT